MQYLHSDPLQYCILSAYRDQEPGFIQNLLQNGQSNWYIENEINNKSNIK